MKCWCFNQEQLDAALKAWVEHQSAFAAAFHLGHISAAEEAIRAFLASSPAREHKLILDGMWDRKDPPQSEQIAHRPAATIEQRSGSVTDGRGEAQRDSGAIPSTGDAKAGSIPARPATPTGTFNPRDDAEGRN